MGLFGQSRAQGAVGETPNYGRGMAKVTIRDVKAIATAPNRANLVVVKIETSEPGLYGLGCATFTQRAGAVVTAIEKYLKPFCIGKDVDNIEDMWNSFYIDSYWRNGPVLNNAISGMDQALWDIKGKRANMPVYQLLGGRSRFAVPAYAGAGGSTPEEVAEQVQQRMEQGFRYVRMGTSGGGNAQGDFQAAGYGYAGDRYMDIPAYLRTMPKVFETVRKVCGDEIELMHDIHEKIQPMEAITLMNNIAPYRPFFLEDPVSPENMGWFKEIRQSTNVPIAMGELFNNINEFLEPMANRYFDFIRCHISQIGGLTPAMKVARLGEWFGIRTAWHGPADVSPVGHAVHAHIDTAIWNFGVQEIRDFTDAEREVFPGAPTHEKGYIHINENPGIGVDIDEKEAAKYPISYRGYSQIRKADGTIIRP
ncbi:enolase C-terminal domain-like protein [Parapedobacter lycopersici]|uniref:enolase C-terminal domain-like protein n=1 Tax=Parapedobacter lycopersici TaxID=1864939 RepID=UPI00214D5673|nr:enolase C-terminal domain-like protein [Parapedobacter lycopersici]